MKPQCSGGGIQQQIWENLIAKKPSVYIYYTTELEDPLFAVSTRADGTGFWFDAFKTVKQALKFCEKFELEVERIYLKGDKID
jgi:hypothetical protein